MLENFIELSQYYPFLLKGVYWTLLLSAISIVGGSAVGMVVALMRVSPFRPLKGAAVVYVDFFRTTPLLVQLIWFFYAFPILIGARLSALEAGCLAMVLYAGAYLAEVFRAGILSVEKGQTEAALALGMQSHQVLARIVLPQAVVRMIPALTNIFISKIKDSSLVMVIGVPEIMRQASSMGEFTSLRMESLTIAAALYFCITFPLSRLTDWAHHRFSTADASQRKSGAHRSDPLDRVEPVSARSA